jgi:hypothetical protein
MSRLDVNAHAVQWHVAMQAHQISQAWLGKRVRVQQAKVSDPKGMQVAQQQRFS